MNESNKDPALGPGLLTTPQVRYWPLWQLIVTRVRTFYREPQAITPEVLAYLDGRKPQTIGTTIELTGPGREARRAWSPHPGCECTRGRRHRAFQADEVQ